MALKVEHEIHERRWGRNLGVGLILAGLIAIVFGLTVVKALSLDDIRQTEGSDPLSPGAVAAGQGDGE